MRRLALPLILGLAHGVADGAAGLLLGGLPHMMTLERVALLVLVYNVLAFGGQPLLGLVADRLGRPRPAALAGLLLLAAALLAGQQPIAAVVLAGLGSAAFHIGGGALALCATQGRAAGPGLFAAPGVVGLAAGGALAASGYTAPWPFLLPLLVLAVVLTRLELPALPYATTTDDRPPTTDDRPARYGTRDRKTAEQRTKNKEQWVDGLRTTDHGPRTMDEAQSAIYNLQSAIPEGHDLVMLVLLAAIALRSAVWSSLQFLFEGRYETLLMMALAAAVGKILGGVLADRIGWRCWLVGALLLAAPLLALGGRNLFLLLPGVALLQSATPAALAMTWRLLPRQPATAAGLGLGLAIAIGGIPMIGGLGPALGAPLALIGVLLAAALALWWALRAATTDDRRPTTDRRPPTADHRPPIGR
jgi:MFS transporter, FSR family, fosmidomycin resistance protein